MTDTEYKAVSDGRRLDVLLSEATGLSRSRVAALMEEGLCEAGGKEIRIVSDGRRADVQLGEASGLSRSRVASLMEAGYCRAGAAECRG